MASNGTGMFGCALLDLSKEPGAFPEMSTNQSTPSLVGDQLRVLSSLPSPMRSPVGSPMKIMCTSPQPAMSSAPIVCASPMRASQAASPSQNLASQILHLQAKLRIAEQKQHEAETRADGLQCELQRLRKPLDKAEEGDAHTKALWTGIAASIGESQAQLMQKLKEEEASWLKEARANLEEKRRSEIWRILKRHLHPNALSDLAMSVKGCPLEVGRLVFEPTARERRQTTANIREMSAPTVRERRCTIGASDSLSLPTATSRLALPPRAPSQAVAGTTKPAGACTSSAGDSKHMLISTVRAESPSVRARIALFQTQQR